MLCDSPLGVACIKFLHFLCILYTLLCNLSRLFVGIFMKKEKNFFAKQLKNIMFEKNLTQKELASLAKTKQERISEWINGVRNPSLSSIENLARALNVDVNYFIESVNSIENKNRKDDIVSIIKLIKKLEKDFVVSNKKIETEISFLKKEIELIKKNNKK